MTALAAPDRDRLARLLGMLGSDYPGEVANAGRLADRLVRAAGLTWADIIAPAALSPPDDPAHRTDHGGADPLRGNWRAMAAACSRYPHLINRWEAEFLNGLHRFSRLSSKQHKTLVGIITRLRAAGCPL